MPTAITVENFRTRFPEFSDSELYTDPVVSLCIDDAELDASESVFGDQWGRAIAWLSAHYVATRYAPGGSGAGPGALQRQTARTVDKVSVTFADTDEGATDSFLSTTRYGQEFLAIARRFTSGPIIAC